ncbi:hypothetical protein D3C87_588130 [compost metagenome]
MTADFDFEERCFEFTLDEDQALTLPWCISQMSYSEELWIAPNAERPHYRSLAADIDAILAILKEEPGFAGMSVYLRDSSTIAITPDKMQKLLIKMKFCGEELIDE